MGNDIIGHFKSAGAQMARGVRALARIPRTKDRKLRRERNTVDTGKVRSEDLGDTHDLHIAATERDAAERDERYFPETFECLRALSLSSKKYTKSAKQEDQSVLRHYALQQADTLSGTFEGIPADLRRAIDTHLEAYDSRALRTIVRNAIHAHFASLDKTESDALRPRRELMMKLVVEACLDRLVAMEKLKPLAEHRPKINREALQYAYEQWVHAPSNALVGMTMLDGFRENVEFIENLIPGYKAFGRIGVLGSLFDEFERAIKWRNSEPGFAGERRADWDEAIDKIGRCGAALEKTATTEDIYVTARIMQQVYRSYHLAKTPNLEKAKAMQSAAAPLPTPTDLEWVQDYVLSKDPIARARHDRKVYAELDALIDELQASLPSAQVLPQSTSATQAQPESTSATQAQPESTSATQAPLASEQPQLLAELLFDWLALGDTKAANRMIIEFAQQQLPGEVLQHHLQAASAKMREEDYPSIGEQILMLSEVARQFLANEKSAYANEIDRVVWYLAQAYQARTQASLANSHETLAGLYFEQAELEHRRPVLRNAVVTDTPQRQRAFQIEGEAGYLLGRRRIDDDEWRSLPPRRPTRQPDQRALAALLANMGGDPAPALALPIAKPLKPDRHEEMDIEFSVEDLARVPDEVIGPQPPTAEELHDRIVGAVRSSDIPALIDGLDALIELGEEQGIHVVFAVLADAMGSQQHIQQGFARLYDAIDTAARRLDDEANPSYEAPRFLDLAEMLREWLIGTLGDGFPTTVDEELVEAARKALLANPMAAIDDVLVPEPRRSVPVPGHHLSQPALRTSEDPQHLDEQALAQLNRDHGDDRNRLIRDLDKMDEDLVALGNEFAADNEPQQLPSDEAVERGNVLAALYADLGGEDLERAVAANRATQSAWVPTEPAGRAPRVPNAKRKDPNRAPPSWMKGGNRLANRDKEELTIEALNARLGPAVPAKEVEGPIFGEEKNADVYRRTPLDSDIEARAKRSSVTIADLIASLDSPKGAVATAWRFVQAVNNLNIPDFLRAVHAIGQVNEVVELETLYRTIGSMTFDRVSQGFAIRRLNNLMESIHKSLPKDKDFDAKFGRLYETWLALKTVNPALGSFDKQSVPKADLRVAKDTLTDLRQTPRSPMAMKGGPDRDMSTVDENSVDRSTPTTSPRSVGWTRAETPRRNLKELSEMLVASVLGKEFGQALQALHELDRLNVSFGEIAKLVQENFRSSKARPTEANVGKFDAIVDFLVIWSRGDLTTAIADKRSALRLRQTADRLVTLWNHLKREPSISGVKQSKISEKERKSAIEVVKGLNPAKSPPAHDLPRLLKMPSRAGKKPARNAPKHPASG